jgi:hypothetical protein
VAFARKDDDAETNVRVKDPDVLECFNVSATEQVPLITHPLPSSNNPPSFSIHPGQHVHVALCGRIAQSAITRLNVYAPPRHLQDKTTSLPHTVYLLHLYINQHIDVLDIYERAGDRMRGRSVLVATSPCAACFQFRKIQGRI